MKKVSNSIKETQKIAEKFASQICPVCEIDQNRAIVVALVGDLGSGKTTFTQFFAKTLGVKEYITSPTFVIAKRYKLKNNDFIHIDAYRIENFQEIVDLDWKKTVNNPKNIIFIEWAEKIKKILPKPYYLIQFGHKSENSRTIDISLVK
jgi:tRNA threonylcarbamoyladenosine biosynthesis protein TsaE